MKKDGFCVGKVDDLDAATGFRDTLPNFKFPNSKCFEFSIAAWSTSDSTTKKQVMNV